MKRMKKQGKHTKSFISLSTIFRSLKKFPGWAPKLMCRQTCMCQSFKHSKMVEWYSLLATIQSKSTSTTSVLWWGLLPFLLPHIRFGWQTMNKLRKFTCSTLRTFTNLKFSNLTARSLPKLKQHWKLFRMQKEKVIWDSRRKRNPLKKIRIIIMCTLKNCHFVTFWLKNQKIGEISVSYNRINGLRKITRKKKLRMKKLRQILLDRSSSPNTLRRLIEV